MIGARYLYGRMRVLRAIPQPARGRHSERFPRHLHLSRIASRKRAVEITRGLLEALDFTGVLCVEFFLTQTGGCW